MSQADLENVPANPHVSLDRENSPDQTARSVLRVFISYAHEDGWEFAKELCDWLEANRFKPWLDDDIAAGQAYDSAIEQAILRCDVVVVLVTAAIEDAESFVRREIQYAHDCGKTVIPVRLAEVQGPILLKTRQWLSPDEALGPKMLARLHESLATDGNSKRIRRRLWRWTPGVLGSSLLTLVSILLVVQFIMPALSVPEVVGKRSPSDEAEKRSLVEFMDLLAFRAKLISDALAHYRESEVQARFLALHDQNLTAIRERKLTLSHELAGQIRELLRPYKYLIQTTYRPNSEDRLWQADWAPGFGTPLAKLYLAFGEEALSEERGDASGSTFDNPKWITGPRVPRPSLGPIDEAEPVLD